MLLPQQRLGDFEIVRLLGKGGMGEVYEAQQFHPARRVALKVLAPWLVQDAEALQRFWREAAVLAQLDHPGIVRIITTGQTPDGLAFYTMQLVRGVSLAELIRRSTDPMPGTTALLPSPEPDLPKETPHGRGEHTADAPLPPPELPEPVLHAYRQDRFHLAARVGAAAARVLAHAHKQGYLHRDVKPSNLMIDAEEHVYVVDFGLTRALEGNGEGSMLGVVRGTPWYMSPEQARGQPLDQRSDIYSLGVTLYELVTRGLGPFASDRDNREAVLAQVRSAQHLPLRMLAPDVPPELEHLIQRAMHFQPRRRYQDAAELARGLDRVAQSSPSIPALGEQRRRKSGRLRAVLAGAAALVALVLGIALISDGGKPSPPPPTAPATPPAPVPAASDDFPVRDRPLRARVSLLRDDFAPVWQRRLWGPGVYHAFPNALMLAAPPDDIQPTLFALDHDPAGRPFEFAVELRQTKSPVVGQQELGIFFGWQRNAADPAQRSRFFVVQLDERPVLKDLLGRVTIGSAQLTAGDKAKGEGGVFDWFRPLPTDRGLIALTKAADWHQVRVRVQGQRVAITVDEGPPREFDLHWLRQADRLLANAPLDPRGALGVWVRGGTASFRNATVMTLPEQDR